MDLVRLVETAVDAAVGWGRSEASVCEPPSRRLADRRRWAGRGGRVLKVSRQGFGLAFQRVTASTYLAVDLDASLDDIVRSTLDQCGPMVRQQANLRARAACSGIADPLDREGFLDPRRLDIDIAAARAVARTLGSEEDVGDWLRERLAELFDHGPTTRFLVHGFTIFAPFRLDPPTLAVDGRIPPRDDHWCGPIVQLTFPSKTPVAEIKKRFEDALLATALHDHPVVSLGCWPTPDVTAAIERRPRRSRLRSLLPADGTVTWQALLEQRLVRVEEAFC